MYRLRHQRQLDNRIARLFAGSENPASPSDPPRAWGAPPGDVMAHPGEDTPETSSPSAWPDRTGIPDVPERGHPWAGRGRGRRHIFARMARAREELLVERGSSSHTRLPLEPLSPPEMHDEDNGASDDDLLYLEPWLHVHPELVDQIGAAAARSRMVPLCLVSSPGLGVLPERSDGASEVSSRVFACTGSSLLWRTHGSRRGRKAQRWSSLSPPQRGRRQGDTRHETPALVGRHPRCPRGRRRCPRGWSCPRPPVGHHPAHMHLGQPTSDPRPGVARVFLPQWAALH